MLYSYSPEDVNVVVGGVYNLSGFTDGSFIRILKDTPTFDTYQSADGVVSRIHSGSNLYTVSLTLHSASQGNQILSYLHAADASSKIAKFPLIIKDSLGTSFFFSATSWVESLPESSYSTDITDRVWSVRCADAHHNVGGNHTRAGAARNILDIGVGMLERGVSERVRW